MPSQVDEAEAVAALDAAVQTLSKSVLDLLRAAGAEPQHIEAQGAEVIALPGLDEEELFASVLLRLKQFGAAGK
jgi:hypothetical protein